MQYNLPHNWRFRGGFRVELVPGAVHPPKTSFLHVVGSDVICEEKYVDVVLEGVTISIENGNTVCAWNVNQVSRILALRKDIGDAILWMRGAPTLKYVTTQNREHNVRHV